MTMAVVGAQREGPLSIAEHIGDLIVIACRGWRVQALPFRL